MQELGNTTMPLHERPLAIFLFDAGAFIQQQRIVDGLRFGHTDSPYELRLCRGEDKSGLALAYLILLFLSLEMAWTPNISSSNDLYTATQQFLVNYTTVA
jgi:hypothetical protein